MYAIAKIINGLESRSLVQVYLLACLYHKKDGELYIPLIDTNMKNILIEAIDFLGAMYKEYSFEELEENLTQEEYSLFEQLTGDETKDFLFLYKMFHEARWIELTQLSKIVNQPIIMAIGKEGLIQGLQYGVLTGRSLLYVESIEAIEEIFGAHEFRSVQSILITYDSNFCVEDLFKILEFTNRYKIPVGFLYPYGEYSRQFIVLKIFLYGQLSLINQYATHFYYPLERDSGVISEENISFYIGNTCIKKKDLKEPCELIFATPHSNGVDIGLGECVLCSRESYKTDKMQLPICVPPCFKSDICSRKGRMHLAAHDIKSIVTFLYTCWGVILEKGTYDVSVSLAYAMIQTAYNPILITTYAMSLLDRLIGPYVALDYYNGNPIGACIQGIGDTVILFGDPEYRCSSQMKGKFTLRQFKSKPELKKLLIKEEIEGRIRLDANIEKEFFEHLVFSECAICGMRLLNLPAMGSLVKRLEEALNNLKQYTLLYYNRWQQNIITNENNTYVYKRWLYYIQLFQKSWYAFYDEMVRTLGGFIRFQVDRYYSLPQHIDEEVKCPYCGSKVRKEKKEIPFFKASRVLLECYNCATIFDGLDILKNGEIVCDRYWMEDEIKLTLKFQLKCSGKYILGLGVIMEAFDKSALIEMPKKYKQELVLISSEEIYSSELTLTLSDEITDGSYYVNAIVMINENIVFFRRSIYINRKD